MTASTSMEIQLRTPSSELRTSLPLAFDEMLSQMETFRARKVLFRGERISGIASYVAGWMAGRGLDPVVLDGANGFDPYMVSSFARRALISSEALLKRIRIARAFTCYQMTTLIEEKLERLQKPWMILLGPATTFLDEDVPEREVGPLFDRVLKKMEKMAEEGVPFFLFQSLINPMRKGGLGVSKRARLMNRLLQFSTMVWRITLEDEGPKAILEKGLVEKDGVRDLGLGIRDREEKLDSQIPDGAITAVPKETGGLLNFQDDR